MQKHTPTISTRRLIAHTAFAATFVLGAFFLGMKSAGDIETIGSIRAGGTVVAGDMNGDGYVTVEDAIIALEIAMDYREPTPEQLLADPNGDYRITQDDVLSILRTLSFR